MKATYAIANPDKVEATLTVTMTIGEWKELRAQLPNEWPGWKFGNEIGDMINEAQKHFYKIQAED